MSENVKIVAVTGARGMIGEIIVQMLLKAGFDVRVLTISDDLSNSSQLTVVSSDINDKNRLRNLLEGVNAIFHCAAELTNEKNVFYKCRGNP